MLAAFQSTWSDARSTFGQRTSQTGAPYDNSVALMQFQSQVTDAEPGRYWSGGASRGYGTANARHSGVIDALAGLEQRLRIQIDDSAQAVTAGRRKLDAVHQWVMAATATAARDTIGEQILLPIVRRGVGDITEIVSKSHGELKSVANKIADIGENFLSLALDQNFATGTPEDPTEPTETWYEYEQALRAAGLLTGPPPEGFYKQWLINADRQGVPTQAIIDIARRHHITPASFDVLHAMEKVVDHDGKSFFLMPSSTSGEKARRAALMTYILSAGTDYGESARHDFSITPYSGDEAQRIIERQDSNSWTYDQDVDFVHNNGGRLVTTPNGMLMGLGGNGLQDLYSEAGGSTWGDIFMLNIDNPADAAQQLRDVAESGVMWSPTPDGNAKPGSLDLDHILHHEERHSQQWAEKGPGTFIREYSWELFREKILGKKNRFEEDAGLSDGGYS